MFYHRTSKRPTEPADHGNPEKNTYCIEIDHNGHKKVKISGTTNIYDKIQEHAESCKIENIVRRFSQGDLGALNQVQGIYEDVVDFPTNYAEAQRNIQALEAAFLQLPLDIRAEFGHSAEQFVAEFGTEKFNKLLKIGTEPEETPSNEE